MQIGMMGLGRMGGNMARRLLAAGHECVVHDRDAAAVENLMGERATGAQSPRELVAALQRPRCVWLMIPAGAVDAAIAELAPLLDAGDTIIDGGNSHYVDDLRRAASLAVAGIHYVDVGVSGGIWGLANGFCLMIGGEAAVVERLRPVFAALAPVGTAAGNDVPAGPTAPHGYLHCGPAGAGHFVKMVHNGIEYGLMAAYAEGINLLKHANVGAGTQQVDAETAPMKSPEHFAYDFDLAGIAEVWRHGSVIRSWLLDLIGAGLARDADLQAFAGQVADSGEGRWAVNAAVEAGVPVPVLATALFSRFASRGGEEFANRVLSALRHEFGGHAGTPPASPAPSLAAGTTALPLAGFPT